MKIKTELSVHSRLERLAYENILTFQRTIKLYTVDPYFASFRKSDRLVYLRDPAEYQPSDPQKLRSCIGISPTQLLVLVYGYIDKRKALKQLLEAISPEGICGICLLIAGEQSDETKELLSSESVKRLARAGKLVEIPRFLNDQEADELFAAADLIWSCYMNSDGNSGVLIKAGRAVRAAVVAPTGIMSKMIADHNAGWIADPNSACSIANVLTEARDNATKRSTFAHNLNRLFGEHTRANFVDPIVEHLVDASEAGRKRF
jgi:glycosyltransferase involved in cell wall biosynthesis